MFGHFGNISLHRQYHKPPPIDSVYPPPEPSPPGPPCPCNVFKIADAAYTALPEETKQQWRDAVKKPGISGYTLWMKENMTAAMREGKLPTGPSASGGFSCRALELAEDPPTWANTIGLAPPYIPPEAPPEEPIPGLNHCNACDPAIPDEFFVTFTGLGGDFIHHNHKYHLIWMMECDWLHEDPAFSIDLSWWPPDMPDWIGRWHLVLVTAVGCYISFEGSHHFPCSPFDTYSRFECRDDGCANPFTCAGSAFASCVVEPF